MNKQYKLKREDDNKVITGDAILWIEWNKNGSFKEGHKDPAIGRSLLVDPYMGDFRWLTTTITKILQQTENYIKFKTENSTYELTKY